MEPGHWAAAMLCVAQAGVLQVVALCAWGLGSRHIPPGLGLAVGAGVAVTAGSAPGLRQQQWQGQWRWQEQQWLQLRGQ